MSAVSGYGGSITYGGGICAIVKKWELTKESDLEDVTGLGATNGNRSFFPTLNGWSGTYEGDMISGSALPTAGASVSIVLLAGAANKTFSGVCYTKSVKVDVPVDGVVGVNVDFQGTGALGGL